MKKLALFPAALVGFMGFAFAYISIFPNSTPFPQFPEGVGTIGGVLSGSFSSTGLAQDSDALGGVAASGYLQNTNCTNPINKVWVGVDEEGKGKCGSLNASLLGYITDYTGSNLRVYSGTTWYPVNSIPFDIYVGNFVETTGATLATVTFSDDSLIRLNTDSKVDFTLGVNSSGATVAQVILAHGEIWGRVLTSTGINFGNSDWIAGVRGTALTMDYKNIGTNKVPNWTGSIDIIDSTNSGAIPAAVVVSQHNIAVKTNLFVNQSIAMVKPSAMPSYTFNTMKNDDDFSNTTSASVDLSNEIDLLPKSTSLMSPWVRENMKKDLIQLANLENSGGISPTLKTRVESEFLASIPKNNLDCTNIVTGTIVKLDKTGKPAHKSKKAKNIPTATVINTTNACTDILNVANTLPEKINKTGCELQSMTYFGSTDPENICEKQGIIARAEYTMSGTLSGSLGMFTTGGLNLLDSQSNLNNADMWFPCLTSVSDHTFNDTVNTYCLLPSPNSSARSAEFARLFANTNHAYNDFMGGFSLITSSIKQVSGLFIDNHGADSWIKYNLPSNVKKIEISVRGAGLMRTTGTDYYLFGIPGGFNLKVKKASSSDNELVLTGFGKINDLHFLRTSLTQDDYYTVVFKKDSGKAATLSIETSTGVLIHSTSPSDIGSPAVNFVGSSLYVGSDSSNDHAFNDVIDSVRIYSVP